MSRDDVVVVGEVGGLMCSMSFVFTYSDYVNIYPITLATGYNYCVMSTGFMYNATNSIPGIETPLYFMPTFVSGTCSSCTVKVQVFLDIDGNRSIGYLAINSDPTLIISTSPAEIDIFSIDPCQASTTDVVASCRYIFNYPVPVGVLSYLCNTTSNGACGGLEFGQTLFGTQVPQFIFTPITVYSQTDCSILTNLTGYIPSPVPSTLCLTYPDSAYSSAPYCRTSVVGFSKPGYCGSDLFSYGIDGAQCGQPVAYVNMKHEEVSVLGSGLCDSGYCVGNGTYSCQAGDGGNGGNGAPPVITTGGNRYLLIAGLSAVVLIIILVAVGIIVARKKE